MTFLRQDVNEHGTPVTWFICDACGEAYWICPARKDVDNPAWNVCLSGDCESYDINRDVEALLFFGVGTIKRSD